MAGPLTNRVKAAWAGARRRMNAGRTPPHMKLVETLNVGGKRQLMLVVCDGERYLIGAGGDSVHSIQPLGKSQERTAECTATRGSDDRCDSLAGLVQ